MQENFARAKRDDKVELKCCVLSVLLLPSLLSKASVYLSCPLILPVAMRMPQERLLCRILPAFLLFYFIFVSVCTNSVQILHEASCVRARIVVMLIQCNYWADLVWFCVVVLWWAVGKQRDVLLMSRLSHKIFECQSINIYCFLCVFVHVRAWMWLLPTTTLFFFYYSVNLARKVAKQPPLWSTGHF